MHFCASSIDMRILKMSERTTKRSRGGASATVSRNKKARRDEELESLYAVVRVGPFGSPKPLKVDVWRMDCTDLFEAVMGSKTLEREVNCIQGGPTTIWLLKNAEDTAMYTNTGDGIELVGTLRVCDLVGDGKEKVPTGKGHDGHQYVHVHVLSKAAAMTRNDSSGGTASAGLVLPTSFSENAEAAKFAAACRATDPGPDGHIRLPGDVEWFAFEHPVLFTRYFYAPLYEHVLAKLNATMSTRYWAIIGTPGIGKSAFGMYLLYQALRQDRTVVYVNGLGGYAYIFAAGGAAYKLGMWESFRGLPQLSDSNTVLLLDSIDIFLCKAVTVLLPSPRPTRTHFFGTTLRGTRLYIPMFSEAELVDMQRVCYPEVEVDLDVQYQKFGGSARFAFNKSEATRALRQFDSKLLSNVDYLSSWLATHGRGAIDDSKLPTSLFRFVTSGELSQLAPEIAAGSGAPAAAGAGDASLDHDHVSVPTGGVPTVRIDPSSVAFYELCSVQFLSAWVFYHVLQMVRRANESKVAAFIDYATISPETSPIIQKVLERMFIEKLEAGGATLKMHQLSGDRGGKSTKAIKEQKLVEVTLPALLKQDFRSLDELGAHADHDNVLYVPVNKGQVAIDFAFTSTLKDFPFVVGNVTLDSAHDIKLTTAHDPPQPGLTAVLGKLKPSFLERRSTKVAHFVFLVPHDRMRDWTHPKTYKHKGVEAKATGQTQFLTRIVQHAASLGTFTTAANLAKLAFVENKYPDVTHFSSTFISRVLSPSEP